MIGPPIPAPVKLFQRNRRLGLKLDFLRNPVFFSALAYTFGKYNRHAIRG
jgi:hypothetical protein